jgi:S1-C subfamily serine protease
MEVLAILIPGVPKDGKDQVQVREARQIAVDTDSDLALLRVSGPAPPALEIRASASVKEGQEIFLRHVPSARCSGHLPLRTGE